MKLRPISAFVPSGLSRRPRFHKTRSSFLFLSGTLWLVLLFFYLFQFDTVHAVTFFPAWIWPIPGILLTLPCWKKYYRIGTATVLALWLLFILATAEEPYSLGRGLVRSWPDENWEGYHAKGQTIRVVSFNCLSDGGKTFAQFAAYKPDLILLQESPLPERIEAFIQQYLPGASFLRGGDSTMIASAGIALATQEIVFPPYTLPAYVRLANGVELNVVSLHLKPPSACADLWNARCRQEQTGSRQRRRVQMQEIAQTLQSFSEETPLIIAGDFNAHGTDAIFRLFRPGLFDTFAQAGLGWGNTMLNDTPLLRFDQVWASHHFQALGVKAFSSLDSDHRYVVCDLRIKYL